MNKICIPKIFVILLVFFSSNSFSQVYIEWDARYDGGFGSDAGFAVTADDSGFVYVTGTSHGTQTRQDMVILKYSPGGVTQWVRRFADTINNSNMGGSSINIYNYYKVYISGTRTYKFTNTGDLIWDSDGRGFSVIDNFGNIYLAGGTGTQIRTRKYNSDGIFLWEKL